MVSSPAMQKGAYKQANQGSSRMTELAAGENSAKVLGMGQFIMKACQLTLFRRSCPSLRRTMAQTSCLHMPINNVFTKQFPAFPRWTYSPPAIPAVQERRPTNRLEAPLMMSMRVAKSSTLISQDPLPARYSPQNNLQHFWTRSPGG